MLHVKAGIGFGDVFVVTVDRGGVVLFHQVMHQLEQGEALKRGTGVGSATVGIEVADIGDTDATSVVTFGMCAGSLNGSVLVDVTVGVDDIMIADVVPAEALMVATDALDGAIGIGAGGGAMDDDFGDCLHGANRCSEANELNGRNKKKQAECLL